MAAGIVALVHVELKGDELEALREGTDDVVASLRREIADAPAASEDRSIAEVDLWILRNLTFYFGVGFANAIANVLPEQIPLLEQRQPRMRQMLDALPAAALD